MFFIGAVGAIDGMHVPIIAPAENPLSYINRKKFHSLLLQGVCDHKLLFTDCYIGEAGSVHDACVFRRSDLWKHMYLGTVEMFPDDTHILGDAAYPLADNLLVPFKNNGRLTDPQKKYNKKHSKARSIIERAFGMLKKRMRKLNLIEMTRVDLIPVVVIACCIIHNLCITQEDDTISESSSSSDSDPDSDDELPINRHVNNAATRRQIGNAKRDRIVHQL